MTDIDDIVTVSLRDRVEALSVRAPGLRDVRQRADERRRRRRLGMLAAFVLPLSVGLVVLAARAPAPSPGSSSPGVAAPFQCTGQRSIVDDDTTVGVCTVLVADVSRGTLRAWANGIDDIDVAPGSADDPGWQRLDPDDGLLQLDGLFDCDDNPAGSDGDTLFYRTCTPVTVWTTMTQQQLATLLQYLSTIIRVGGTSVNG